MSLIEKHLGSILDQACDLGVTAAASLWVGSALEPQLIMHRGDGINDHSIYDLASLTKIMGTLPALVFALNKSVIHLHEKPFLMWPHISIYHLLAHRSGLIAHQKFYKNPLITKHDWDKNKITLLKDLYQNRPLSTPGTTRIYSDLNFLALGDLLEKRHHRPLEKIIQQSQQECGIKGDLSFFTSTTDNDNTLVVPTGYVRDRGFIRAQVHDDNCYIMGGIAGHAGLFGNLLSVAQFGQFLLRAYKNPQNDLERTLRYCAIHNLGFDAPSKRGSIRFLSPLSFGHFGFTGVSLWVDPLTDRGLGRVIVLLSNRVSKSHRPEPIFWLREKIHKIIMQNTSL